MATLEKMGDCEMVSGGGEGGARRTLRQASRFAQGSVWGKR